MRYALFLGCTIPARMNQYELSARAVLDKLDVELVDIRDFNCCGYPLRNYDVKSFILSSARNVALAERHDLNIITLCKCCYGSLRKADYLLREDLSLRKEINDILARENLQYEGGIEIKHLLSVLYHDIGVEALRERVEKPYREVKIATHYGCHALRPSDVVQFDDPSDPRLFDDLVEITGARSIKWSNRLECCGAPLLGVNDDLSMDLMEKKLSNGRESGADYLCVACPYCQLQFDRVQSMMISQRGGNSSLPSILYTQLLGLSMGIDADTLQIEANELDISGIKSFL
jgi:heterodisulfide reductase subunit B